VFEIQKIIQDGGKTLG